MGFSISEFGSYGILNFRFLEFWDLRFRILGVVGFGISYFGGVRSFGILDFGFVAFWDLRFRILGVVGF